MLLTTTNLAIECLAVFLFALFFFLLCINSKLDVLSSLRRCVFSAKHTHTQTHTHHFLPFSCADLS